MSGVEITDRYVRRTLPGGRVEEVSWADLAEVRIITSTDGPFADDVFFVLIGARGNGCAVPQSAGGKSLLHRLQALPGFDNEAVVAAMGCTTDHQFLCWRRAN
ncbi:hypothetical protein [Nocardia harenae]|uniref:hypothetical protein n=1 Tax=Nocardia harenae TaxID=358707 RepID=UPI000AFA14F8|nr:hypothetical protein [Nocardia harenae]